MPRQTVRPPLTGASVLDSKEDHQLLQIGVGVGFALFTLLSLWNLVFS